ncbi:MAG: hypothetical protein EOP83_15820 [Verrucomicrobiaceae bacterium]|nr:MAG: hypothetical protein EOP83_15820 [Verrucomicrobiaceae bacterium]
MTFIERKFDAGHWRCLFWRMETLETAQEEQRMNDEIRTWCEDQFGPGGIKGSWRMSEKTGALTFHNLTYAAAFKTRWMTATYVQRVG